MDKISGLLNKLDTSQISDSMGRTGVPRDIYPMNLNLHMAGSAYTVRVSPGDNLMLHLATKQAKPGDVIVVDGSGLTSVALWGEMMSLCAKTHGIAGIVIDGAVRDSDALSCMDFPVYARGICPRGPVRVSKGEVNISIQCGGVVVNPGDYVVGDRDGVVIIPKEKIDAVIDAASSVAKREEQLKKRIISGEYLLDIFGLEELVKK